MSDTPAIPADEPHAVTADRAASLVGVPRHQVSSWVERGEIWNLAPHGSHPKLYSLRRCRELAEQYHARKAKRKK